jgi:hypothetical protein
MIIMDNPYVSDLLINTVESLKLSILKNEMSENFSSNQNLNITDASEFMENYHENIKLYTNTESSLDWIYKHLPRDKKSDTIRLFKDKAGFRNIVKDIYPDFFYTTISCDKLAAYDINKIKLPIVLKPNVGFFSYGVYTIRSKDDWTQALAEINELAHSGNDIYNEDVISHSEYIIEEYISGDEYAVDGYYDENGQVVVLNILKHIFASETDVDDKLYITNKKIIKEYLDPIKTILNKVNKIANTKNFPFHFEVRIDGSIIVPIEMNPLRFAGWCTTDIAKYAYGTNVYDCFFNNKKPDWESIFKEDNDSTYAIVVMGKTSNSHPKSKVFNYDSLGKYYNNILDIRKADYSIHSIYGFMFLSIDSDHEATFDRILNEDFDRFLA